MLSRRRICVYNGRISIFILFNLKNMEHEEIVSSNEEGNEEADEATSELKVRDNLEVVTKGLDEREKSFDEEHGTDYNSTK